MKMIAYVVFVLSCVFLLTSASSLSFLQLTDPHFDPDYCVGCDTMSECRSGIGRAGLFGYGDRSAHCQPPLETWLSALEYSSSVVAHPDAVLATGDLSRSGNPSLNISENQYLWIMGNVTDALANAFPDSLVVPVLGNHDSYPGEMPTGPSWMYDRLGEMWSSWLPGDARKQFESGGFYSIPGGTSGLRFLVLNSCLYVNGIAEGDDPAGQFDFMQSTLKAARDSHESVWILGHCYPGAEFRIEYNRRIVSLLSDFADVIAGQVYGHMHRDMFQLVYDDEGKGDNPVGVIMISPAITMDNGAGGAHSPAFRVFEVESNSHLPINYVQYVMNLTRSNEEKKGIWEKEYDWGESYGFGDLSPLSFERHMENLKDADNFAVFWRRFYTDWFPESDYNKCNEICQRVVLCLMKAGIDDLRLAECIV